MREYMELAYKNEWVIIPLKENSKEPNLPRGHSFLSERPSKQDYKSFNWGNYGIVCGPISGICVLDIDGAEGNKTLEEREIVLSDLYTPKVYTPNGIHVYFKYHPAVKTGVRTLGPGLDIRSKGSYVVGAGSSVNGKHYIESDAYPLSLTPMDAPEFLTDLTREDGDGIVGEDYYTIPDYVREGERNDKTLKLASYFVSKDMPPQMVLDMIWHFNKRWVTPPLDEREVRQICDSAERYRCEAKA